MDTKLCTSCGIRKSLYYQSECYKCRQEEYEVYYFHQEFLE